MPLAGAGIDAGAAAAKGDRGNVIKAGTGDRSAIFNLLELDVPTLKTLKGAVPLPCAVTISALALCEKANKANAVADRVAKLDRPFHCVTPYGPESCNNSMGHRWRKSQIFR